MKTIRMALVVSALTVVAFASLGQAARAKHVATHATKASAQGMCSDPSKCPLGCKSGASASTASMATAASMASMASGKCSGADASKCPASCRKDNASAMASNVKH